MEIKVDRQIFPDECISKVVYWLSGEYSITRRLNPNNIEVISLKPMTGQEDMGKLETMFFQKLNDFKLRQIVEDETHDIRTILYAKAFEKYVD